MTGAKHECTCYLSGWTFETFEGPQVDCDVHGLPSAAFEAGRRQGAQEERDQQRIRGDLCRWCHRQPQPQLGERHGNPVQSGPEGDVVDIVCLDGDGYELSHGYTDEPAPF